MKYSNPKIPEGINYSKENSLKEFALLSAGVIAVILLLYWLLSLMADWLTDYVPFSYEQQLAAPFIAEYKQEDQVTPVEGANEVREYLQQLADDITPLMDLPKDINITLHYINSDTVNAMATLGGNVFIFRGLLEKIPNENALVMLLAHEIAHVKLRHPVKALGKGVLASLLLAVVSGQSNIDATSLVANTGHLAFLGFSRGQEQDADIEATELTYAYYQNTRGAEDLLTVLFAESQKEAIDTIGLFRSHPEVAERINKVMQLSVENAWAMQGESILIPEKILSKL